MFDDNLYKIYAFRNLLISIGLFILYFRKKRNTFLYIGLGLILYVLIYLLNSDLIVANSVLILISLLSISFCFSFTELLTFEKQGKSFAEFASFDKFDFIYIGLLFVIYFIGKIYFS